MKKTIVLLGVAALVLTGCGQKKEAAKEGTNKEPLSTTLPVFENAEKSAVVTKTLTFPKSAEGVEQKQVVTYQDKQFLELVIEQITPANEDIKKAIAEIGIPETQKLLDESLGKDEAFTKAKELPGFSATIEIINDNQLKRVNKLDFKTLDIDKASQLELLKGLNLKEFIKIPPADYITNQVAGGATVTDN
ncbi:SP0191 family lipoprotein [Streptococcus himalayensis]|uniref:SP-0191-like C-terminal domain-containing protein n=1 Tax=Streptococcus himalayensis TaxID=1888195 RepID=A0A917A2E0_9STRE|nr:SP0191 family lipoprotein [Streptococcus himalayensis]GGE23164.1 hypothetical protein GCM10011510_00290 [Streptococcus himalayensis]